MIGHTRAMKYSHIDIVVDVASPAVNELAVLCQCIQSKLMMNAQLDAS